MRLRAHRIAQNRIKYVGLIKYPQKEKTPKFGDSVSWCFFGGKKKKAPGWVQFSVISVGKREVRHSAMNKQIIDSFALIDVPVGNQNTKTFLAEQFNQPVLSS